MHQLTFTDPPIARATDPDVSKEAAEKITRSGRRARDQELLLRMIGRYPRQTAIEYADGLIVVEQMEWYRAFQVANKRMSDLHAKGLVRPVGQRTCRITGSTARTWEAVFA